MVGYVTIGTNDFEKALAFYDELLSEIGARRLMGDERFQLWGKPGAQGGFFAVCKPYDEKPATVGNGQMVAISAESRENVEKLHAKALELGGTDEGPPGPRGAGNFYGGYFRDLDGNKLVAFVMS